MARNVLPVVIQCLIFMYENQTAWVKWGEARSSNFAILNRTRQGTILSPTFWACYCDPMIKELRNLGVGAHFAGVFMGVVCYADDILLIAPNRTAMVKMIEAVEGLAEKANITFSMDPTPAKSKSK